MEATDQHVTFVKTCVFQNFSTYNRADLESTYTFNANEGLDEFVLRMYPMGTSDGNDGYVCFSIELNASEQESIDLSATLSIAGWTKYVVPVLVRGEGGTIHRLASSLNVTRLALDDDALTIGLGGSYANHRHHQIVTSPTNWDAHLHKYVNMTYTWTVCNLKLPLVGARSIVSADFPPAVSRLPQFYLSLYPGTAIKDYVALDCTLRWLPKTMQLPITANHTFTLIGSSTSLPGDSVLHTDSSSLLLFEEILHAWGQPRFVKYSQLVDATRNKKKCATVQYHSVYYTT